MTKSTPAEVELAWDTFHQVVNMTAEELRTWPRSAEILMITAGGSQAVAIWHLAFNRQGPSQVRIAPLRAALHHRATDPLSRAPLSRLRLFMPTR